MTNTNSKMAFILYLLTLICSILSQHPMLIGTTTAAILRYCWAIPFIYMIGQHGLQTNKLHYLVKTYFYFALFFVLYDLFLAGELFKIDADIKNILISLLVFVTSYLFWYHHHKSWYLKVFCIVLIICVSYVAYSIYTSYIALADLESQQYAYGSKNSIATIILGITITFFFNIKPANIWFSLLGYGVLLLLIIFIFLLKCRSTILGVLFFICYIAIKYKDKKIQYCVAIGSVCIVLYIATNPETYDLVVNHILLNSHSTNDLSGISSGRDELLKEEWINFQNHPFFGYGEGYVDSFPFQILINYGVIGSFCMLLFITRLFKSVSRYNPNSPIQLSAFVLFIVYMLNSLFEAYPPFGSGIKCFILWMLIGFSCAEKQYLKTTE